MSSPSAAPARNPWVVLVVLCTAVFMLLLDTTIVNNAQVQIRRGLDANLTQIQWVLDSYILTYAVLLLSFGRLGDIFGRKRLFLLGMALFTVASGLCGAVSALSDATGLSAVNLLIGARVLQGVGGALMMPSSLSLLSVVFPPEKRGTAMGIWGSVVGLGAVAGPVIGGYLVTNYDWEWVFLINLPVGAAALLAAYRIIPESVDPDASRRLDWTGLGLSAVGIFLIVFALIEGNAKGWTSATILGSLAAGAALLAVFVRWERRVADPMMKIELFRQRNFVVGNFLALTVSFGMLGIFFPLTIFLQGVLGFSAIRSGMTVAPMSIAMLVAAPLAGRLTDTLGARWILTGGLSTMVVGLFWIIRSSTLGADWRSLAPSLLLTGLGMGFTFAPMTAAAMRDVPRGIVGSASGILNTTRNIGQVLGIAVLGSLLQSRVGSQAGDRLERLPLDDATRDQVTGLAQQSQFERIAAVVPAELSDGVLAAVRGGFVEALHNTFTAGALLCAVAAGMALLIRNPVRQPAPSTTAAAASPQAAD